MSPIFEYACLSCGAQAELRRPMNERDEPPSCECGEAMQRILSAPNVPASGTYSYRERGKR